MIRGALIVLSLLALPQGASAQPGSLNETQQLGLRLFIQSCGVCHTKPQMTSALRAGAVEGFARRPGRRHARGDQQRHAAHAGLQVSFRAAEIDAIVAYLKTVPAPPPAPFTATAPRRDAMRNARCFTLAGLRRRTARAASRHTAIAADVVLSGTDQISDGRDDGRRHGLGQGRGATITTTVFTDDAGHYYFPPLPAGKYRVWAQALGFETAKGDVDLAAARKRRTSCSSRSPTSSGRSGNCPATCCSPALPEETPDDVRMKRLVRNNCTGCHTASYVLQHRFDEAGWSAIIELMKRVNVYGVVQPDPAGERHPRLPPEGARRLSRARPRARRKRR